MKRLILLYLLLCCWMLGTTNTSAQTWEEFFKKPQKLYHKGQYSKSIRASEKLLKKIDKKYKGDSLLIGWVSLQKAYAYQALGQMPEVTRSLNEGLAPFGEQARLDRPWYTIQALLKAAEVALEAGNYPQADAWLTTAAALIQQDFSDDLLLAAELGRFRNYLRVQRGEWQAQDSLIAVTLEQWERIVKQPSLQYQRLMAKVSKPDLIHRKRARAYALRMATEAHIFAGDFAAAEQLLNNQSSALNVDKSEQAAHLILKGDLALAQEDYKNAEKQYASALKTNKFYHYITLSAMDKYLEAKALEMAGKGSSAWSKLLSEYENRYEKWVKHSFNYPTGISIHQFRLQSSKAYHQWLITENATQALQNSLNNVVRSGEGMLPLYHPVRAQAALRMAQLNTHKLYNLSQATQAWRMYLQTRVAQLGADAPALQPDLMAWGDFNIQYTNHIDTAKTVFEDRRWQDYQQKIKPLHPVFGQMLLQSARYQTWQGEYPTAISQTQQALELLRKRLGENDSQVADLYNQLADRQWQYGQYNQAVQTLQQSAAIMEQQKRQGSDAYVQLQLIRTTIYTQLGYYAQANTTLKDLKRLIKKDAMSLSNKYAVERIEGQLATQTGDYKTARALLPKLLNAQEQSYGSDNKALMPTIQALAQLYLTEGDYNNADKLLRRAEDIRQQVAPDQSLQAANSLFYISRWATAFGDYDKVVRYLSHSLPIYEQKLDSLHIDRIETKAGLALAQLYTDPEALPESKKTLLDLKNTMDTHFSPEHPLYAKIVKTLAIIYLADNQPKNAIQGLESAYTLWREKLGKRNNEIGEIEMLMGDAYLQLKDLKEADKAYKQAQKSFRKTFSIQHPNYVKAGAKRAQIQFLSGDHRQAAKTALQTTQQYLGFIQTYFAGLSEREKAVYWNVIQPEFEFFNTMAINIGDPELIAAMYNYALSTKALLLSSSLKVRQTILSSGDEQLIAKYQQWADLKNTLAASLHIGEDQEDTLKIDLAGLQQSIEKVEKELSESSEVFKQSLKASQHTWQDVQSRLNTGEAAIELIRTRHFDGTFTDSVLYVALIVTPNTKRAPEWVVLPHGSQLEQRFIVFYRKSMSLAREDKISYKQFWEPIQAKLTNIQRVYLSSDGVYHQLSPASFWIEDEGRYLFDKLDIALVSNTRDLLAPRQTTTKRPDNAQAVLYGNPTFYAALGNSFDPGQVAEKRRVLRRNYIEQLPGADTEVDKISQRLRAKGWDVQIFKHQEADERSLKNLNSPVILHIATHGYFVPSSDRRLSSNRDPMLHSGILMRHAGDYLSGNISDADEEDNLFTAYEALTLRLDNTEMVVFSACETGLGDVQVGEGVYGLQRSLLVAGAKTLLMSIFKVSDEATQLLMDTFYERWLSHGNKRQAFREAQTRVRTAFPHPIYWGAFNMIGLD